MTKSFVHRLLCALVIIAASGIANAATSTTSAPTTKPTTLPVLIDEKRAPGLVGQYYKSVRDLKDFKPAATQPFFVRVDKRISFNSTNGQFYRTKLAMHFAATWTGYLRIKEPGEYLLQLKSDDGSMLYLADQMVMDNQQCEVMKEKQAKVTLAAGDYPIKVLFHQIGGGAGCLLQWRRPTDAPDQEPHSISAESFFHDAAQEQVAWNERAWHKAAWSRKAWAKQFGEQFDKMDYGPFFSASIAVDPTSGNVANKGIAIHLGKNDEATICFDTDLLRLAGGWTGGFLDNHGVVFDGAHGVNPGPDGELLFSAPVLPGAACGLADEKLSTDPRAAPYGPLPRDQAKYKGLYLHGDRVVLHYTVGDVDVLESPWAQKTGDEVVITRTIKLSPSDQPLTMLIDKPDPERPVKITMSDGVQGKTIRGVRYVVFPPRKEPATYQIALSPGDAPVTLSSEDLDDLLKPGPARWGQPIETKGVINTATTQPYVVDTLTAPEDNPYHSWLRFGGLDFFSDGRAAVSTWSGDVWIVSGIDDKLEKLTWKRYATGLFQALGLRIVDDTVYVLGRDQITRLHDTNNDGEADHYECFNNDCQVSKSFHEFAFDLQTDPQGNFYYSKAGPVRPGGKGWEEITAHNGSILRVSKDGSKFEVFATGVRAPNGMCVGPQGQVTVGDNEGTWTPTCRISWVKQGDFLGVVDLSHLDKPPTTFTKPICWLPHGEVDNSSGGQVWVQSDKWGPFDGRLLHTSYGKCALFLVMTETLDGQIQGGVVQFPKLDFISGICRPRFNPKDKQLYIAGLRGWQTTAAKDCALQRVRYTGAAVKMPAELHVTPTGLSIGFTSELDASVAVDAGNFAVEQWNYKWSGDYGSDEYSVAEPKTRAHDPVDVKKVTLSPDKKTVTLQLEKIEPVMQMKVQMKLKSADGTPMDYSIYHTINQVPKGAGKAPATTTTAARN